MLEIVGQKRVAKQTVAPYMRVNSKSFSFKLSPTLMEQLGLKAGSQIAFGYENGEAYIITDYSGEGAIKLGKQGTFNSSYHSNKLRTLFSAPISFNVDIATTATTKKDSQGNEWKVYNLTLSSEPAVTRLKDSSKKSSNDVAKEEEVEVTETAAQPEASQAKWE